MSDWRETSTGTDLARARSAHVDVSSCSFRLLGAIEVSAADDTLDLGPPKQRALLAALVLHANEILSSDRLIELLWGDSPPRTAAHSVQIYVSDLRKVLATLPGGAAIETVPPGYRMRIDEGTVDVFRFEQLVEQGVDAAHGMDTAVAIARLREALTLWRGEPLQDFAYAEFAQPHIRRLEGRRGDALEELAGVELAAGQVRDAVRHAELLHELEPLRERAVGMLMLGLYRSGRHVQALRTYQTHRKLLAEELGVTPSPALQRLNEQVLLHDAALEPEPSEDANVATLHAPARNPYKGLRPFREADAGDFFGREELVERMLADLATGRRLIALVGPSGCGKSSVVAAGLVPALRAGRIDGSEEWLYATVVPGVQPLREVEAVIARAASSRAERRSARSPTRGPTALAVPDGAHALLVIDQFEEVYRAPDDLARKRFLDALAGAVSDPEGRVSIVLTLRADFYDQPLLHHDFASAFTSGVINVLPMTTAELNAAVIEPARSVGVEIQPELVSELVADTVNQPGSLPLMQYALSVQFDVAKGTRLDLDDYSSLGGMRAALTRRAEDLFAALTPDQQRAAMQILLRMVRVGHGRNDAVHRVAVAELAELDLDPVALSEVLDQFGGGRLLSFDADPISNAARVGLAHEALLTNWDRLAESVERHRTALRRYEGLRSATIEWEEAGRHRDYLLAGARLAEVESWSTNSVLALTESERSLIEQSVSMRQAERVAQAERAGIEHRRARRGRQRLIVLVVAIVLLVAGLALALVTRSDGGTEHVGLYMLNSGEVTDMIENGFDRGVSDFQFAPFNRQTGAGTDDTDPETALDQAANLRDLVVVFSVDADVDAAAARHPQTRFILLERPSTQPNVTTITFPDNQGSFLAGAAAALKSQSGTIGFMGGVDFPVIWEFEAGFEAGAKYVNPDIEIITSYLSQPPDFDGFSDPEGGERVAAQLFQQGADIVFAAAGRSGVGAFQAAADLSSPSRHLWVIGVDSDQYETVRDLTGTVNADQWVDHILTSVVKHYELAVYDALAAHAAGHDMTGIVQRGLDPRGVELSYSGGFIADIRPQLEAIREQIVSGDIDVPCRLPSQPMVDLDVLALCES